MSNDSAVLPGRLAGPGRRIRRALTLAIALLAAATATADATPRPTVDVQLLSISDWHAQLDPMSVSGVGDVGGAAVLSSYFHRERADNPNTLTLTAGDAFGASPPLSGQFDEEPAVRAMNLMGFDADALGNHNFDRGVAHLRSMTELAEFPYLAANLRNAVTELPLVKPYEIFEVGGVKVAVIGITNPEAPTLVKPGNFGSIEPTDPVPAANKARARAKQQGAQVFVAITHMGVTSFDPATGEPRGPLVDFAENVGGFDVILGDHTDIQYSGVINGALVVENRSKGLTYARTTLAVDPRNGRVADRRVQFVTPLARTVTPDPAVVDMLAPYRAMLAERFDQPMGVASDVFPRGGNVERLREVALGNLVADAMRERYGTQIALTNGGGLRAALPSSYLPADRSLRRASPGYAPGPPYDLVMGDAFTVLPFGNTVVTRTVSGQQLYGALELSVSALPAANGRFLQISGFRFAYDQSRPAGSRVVWADLADGTPILRDSTPYTVALPDFVNAGGDGYTMFADGAGITREVMADVLLDHVRARGTIAPVVDGRITRVG
ncbi:MAG TPA: 5'-nucleotidase C-terminal domain-containing protein [Solirubrobacteraceae bacterium]|nr:5'-nucleotidase C-terminal domain-containing protein [Solirubrobacteraceae bacterium]